MYATTSTRLIYAIEHVFFYIQPKSSNIFERFGEILLQEIELDRSLPISCPILENSLRE